MKTCFGYVRVSTLKQGDGVSLQEQKSAIELYADRNHLEITQWFEEKETAAKKGRPIFNRMLRDLRGGKASGLIMHKIDRSARNLGDWAIVSELPDEGVDVYIATESLDFNSRGGRLTADMLAVISADYIRNLREETIKGIRGRLKQGLYPFGAPIGYLDNGGGKPKTPCPEKAPLIREMFELYGTRQYALRSLHVEMKRRGLRNARGNPLSVHGIETILSNLFYTGIIILKSTGESFQGVHEPIISPSLFKQVQDIKAGRCGPKLTRHNHLFRGLFRCGLCDGPMSPEKQKGIVYYRCQRPECETKTVREDVLSEQISKTLKEYVIPQDASHEFVGPWQNQAHDGKFKSGDGCAFVTLNKCLEEEKQKQDRLTDLLLKGVIDEQTYRDKNLELKLTQRELQEELNKIPDPEEIKNDNAQYLELMKNVDRLYENLPPEEKRVFLENAFSNRTVIGKSVYFEPHLWLENAVTYGGVPSGDPHRYTDRTFRPQNELKRLFRLFFETRDAA